MTTIRCERCGKEYPEDGKHYFDACMATVLEERDRLRSFVAAGGPDARQSELRDVLFRTENERRMLVDALSRTQKRGTELLEETRALKSEIDLLRREVVLARRPVHGPCGNEAPGQLSSLAGLHCELPWGHEGWHQSGKSTWTHGKGNQENLREGSAVRIPGVGEV